MEKTFVVDAYSILFRTYYSVGEMNTSNNIPIGGVFGFVRAIFSLIQRYSVSNLIITLDSGKKTFRSEIYSEYKTNRIAVPESLIPQFGILQEFLDTANICNIKQDGYEADDIIASIIHNKQNSEFSIVTSDKDLMQLVNEKVTCVDFFKNKTYSISDVIEKFGIEPRFIVDYLALLGDASDNIPGIKGCGSKGAISLIKQFGTLENIIANAEKIPNNRLRDAIKNNIEIGILSKKLASLNNDISLPKLDDSISAIKFNHIKEFLIKYEMKSLFYMLEKLQNNLQDNGDNIRTSENYTQAQLL